MNTTDVGFIGTDAGHADSCNFFTDTFNMHSDKIDGKGPSGPSNNKLIPKTLSLICTMSMPLVINTAQYHDDLFIKMMMR